MDVKRWRSDLTSWAELLRGQESFSVSNRIVLCLRAWVPCECDRVTTVAYVDHGWTPALTFTAQVILHSAWAPPPLLQKWSFGERGLILRVREINFGWSLAAMKFWHSQMLTAIRCDHVSNLFGCHRNQHAKKIDVRGRTGMDRTGLSLLPKWRRTLRDL